MGGTKVSGSGRTIPAKAQQASNNALKYRMLRGWRGRAQHSAIIAMVLAHPRKGLILILLLWTIA